MTATTPSITSWTRLEPRTRSADLDPGLEARLADPLWLLARQWQLGELRGEDAGSPVSVRVRAHADLLTRFRGPGTDPVELERGMPLEAYVERETPATAEDLRLAAETGRLAAIRLRRGGHADIAADLAGRYRLRVPDGAVVDEDTAAIVRTLSGRYPDGIALRAAVTAAGGLPSEVTAPPARRPALHALLLAWAAEHAAPLSVGSPQEDAWDDARMAYSFAVAAAGPRGETVLVADGYDGDRLDWSDLDVDPAATLGAVASPATTETIVRSVLPAPASYPGMPAPRWWQMEDARISFGRVATERTDLARMLLIEFSSVYANDHFLVPLDVPVGSLTRIDSVVVTDTFGERIVVPPAPTPAGWSLYRPTRLDGTGHEPVLVVLPTVVDTLHSAPVEEVVLLRDELANLVWGVESHVASAAGRPVDRHTEEGRRNDTQPPPPDPTLLHYRLQTPVPEHWIPFVPVERAVGVTFLRRALQQRVEPDGRVVPVLPLGRVLARSDLEIPEEEVPAAGLRVLRQWQSSRWVDGSTHVWLGSMRKTGRGPGSSGLRYDIAEPLPPG